MAHLDRMHDMTQSLRHVIDKYDNNIDSLYDSAELREILRQLYLNLSSHEGFKISLANADTRDRLHEDWDRERRKEVIKKIMWDIEDVAGHP